MTGGNLVQNEYYVSAVGHKRYDLWWMFEAGKRMRADATTAEGEVSDQNISSAYRSLLPSTSLMRDSNRVGPRLVWKGVYEALRGKSASPPSTRTTGTARPQRRFHAKPAL